MKSPAESRHEDLLFEPLVFEAPTPIAPDALNEEDARMGFLFSHSEALLDAIADMPRNWTYDQIQEALAKKGLTK